MKIKKLVLILMILFIFVLTGCGKNKSEDSKNTQVTTMEETTAQDLSEPNQIGLYLKQGGQSAYELIAGYEGNWTATKDIQSFEAFASNEAMISGDSYGNLWKARWNDHPDASVSKIGYSLGIVLKDGETLTEVMKSPSDTVGDFNKYIEVWIYDDIFNLDASWYSHLTEADFYDTSLMTSIKLTAGEKIDDIQQLKLTAFIYDSEEDFDQETGEYIGGNSYEISILRTN